MGKFGSLSSSSSSGSTTTSSSTNNQHQNSAANPSKEQLWVGVGPNKTVTSGTTGQEWKSVDLPAYSSPRRRKKPGAADGEGSEQPSKASTDVSSSSKSSSSSATSEHPPKSEQQANTANDNDVKMDDSDSDGSESESDSKIVKQILNGSSHEESLNADDDEEDESETESMKMRRILYGSINTNVDSNMEGSQQQATNNNSISSIGGPGTGTARRAVVPDTVQEMDEDQTDDGDLAPLQQSASFSQSQNGSASRSFATSSKSGSSCHSPSQSRGSLRSGSMSTSSSRTPPASPYNSHSGSTTPSSRRSGSVASKYLSQSSRSSATTALSPQQSASQRSRSFASQSQRSNSSSSSASSRSHPWESNHTGTNSASRSRSTHSGSQSQRDTASEGSPEQSASVGSKENDSEGSKSKQSDPPASLGSRELKKTIVDPQEPSLGNSQGDLNDSVRSRESILQRLRERRRAQETETKDAEPSIITDGVPLPPPKELARDPSGDLKSFTGEYEIGSEGNDGSGEGKNEESELEKDAQEDRENMEEDVGASMEDDERSDASDGSEAPASVEKSPKVSQSDSSQNDEGASKEGENDHDNVKSSNKKEGETDAQPKAWSPVKEKNNVPLTLHKLGSHDTDDWKPPALTNFGEQRYIPATRRQDEGRKDPDAEGAVRGLFGDRPATPELKVRAETQAVPKPFQHTLNTVERPAFTEPAKNIEQEENQKEGKQKRPPVLPPPEITLISSLDDDSTLGTDGTYLERFPKTKKKKEPIKAFTPAVVPRFAQGDSVAGGHEVKQKPTVVPRFAQEDSIAGGNEVKKIVPRFAQEDSIAGVYEVKKKSEFGTSNAPVAVPRFAQGDSIAGAHEIKMKSGTTMTDSEGSIPRFIGGDALVPELAWANENLRPPPQQKEAQDDYYRSWIQAQTDGKEQPDRQDPPGNLDLIPFNPKSSAFEMEEDRSSSMVPSTPFNFEINRDALRFSTWVPREKKPEVPRSDSIPSLPVYYYKSERSTNSAWGAPGMQKGRSQDDVDLEARRLYIDSIMSKKRPTSAPRAASAGKSARVDYTGTISSTSPSKSSSSRSSSYVTRTSRSATSRSGEPSSGMSHPSRGSRSSSVGTPSRRNAPSPSRSISTKHQQVEIPSPPLLGAVDDSETSHSIEVVDENSRTDAKSPTKGGKFDDWSESSHDIEVFDETARAATQASNPPEHPTPQPNTSVTQQSTKQIAPYMTSTTIVAIVVAIFFILAGIGVVIYFFVVPLFQDRSTPTQPPTPAPTIDTSFQGLQNFISDVSPETTAAFQNPSSPQSLALAWLADNQFLGTYSTDQILQRFVMATLYYATDGGSWESSDLWLSDITECEWYSSESQTDVCNGNAQLDEIDLNGNGLMGSLPWNEIAILQSQLLILDVFSNQVSGSLDPSVGMLSSLIVLDLQRNGFTGTIPREIEQLTSMKHLILAENNFSGTIPTEIAGMSDLESLNLSGNALQGSIPDVLGEMTALRHVFLDGNDLVGTIPSELCARSLENLVVDCGPVVCDCCTCGSGTTSPPLGSPSPVQSTPPNQPPPNQVPGPTPTPTMPQAPQPSGPSPPIDTPTDGSDLQNLILDAFPESQTALQDPDSPQSQALEWLQSSANDAVSTEEGVLQRFALATLYYATNGDGWNDNTAWLSSTDECSWISTADSLNVCDNSGRYLSLDLQENNLEGTIPQELGILSSTLKTINFRANRISGDIPATLQDLTDLETLDLSSNNLEGAIPPELFEATNLRQLSLFENTLVSTLPPEVGQLSRLELLDVGANQLTGTLPSTLGQLTRLAGLSVFDNEFTGTLPQELANAKSLQLLYVDSNDLRPPLPTDVCLLNLEEFWSDCEEIQCVCCTTCCSEGFGCFET